MGSRVVFNEEILAMLRMKKSENDTEMTKSQNFSNFQRFYANFPKFSTDFILRNVETGQQGKDVLSRRKETNAVFHTEIVRN